MDWIFLGIIVVMIVVMLLMTRRRQKRAQESASQMMDRLRPGMRVKTVAGLIGRIKEIRQENSGLKTILLETGHGRDTSFMLYDAHAILNIMDEAMSSEVFDPSASVVENAKASESEPVIVPVEPVTTINGEPVPDDGFNASAFVAESNKSRKKK